MTEPPRKEVAQVSWKFFGPVLGFWALAFVVVLVLVGGTTGRVLSLSAVVGYLASLWALGRWTQRRAAGLAQDL